MQLRHYAWVIWRSLWLILLMTSLITGATYVISKLITPVYQASTLIQVNEAGNNSTVFGDQAQAITYSLLVTNNVVLQATARELPGVSVSQLKDTVSASPIANTSIIELRAQANNPYQAADIANAVGQIFIQIQVTRVTAALQSRANQLTQELVTARANVTTAQAQLTTLQKSQASAQTIAHQAGILNDAQASYDTLLLNYQQIQLQELQVNDILSQVQRATPPEAPLSPRATLNTAIAAAMSLLLMTVFALLLDWIDASIKTPEDVARMTMLEPLGSVPLSKRPLISVNPLGTSTVNDGAVEQAFMIIGMSFNVQHRNQRAVLVTGLRPGAGTTTTATNLAISLAQLGKHVLLVDANLHRPSLHTIFQCSNTKGLADSLSDVYRLHAGVVHAWLGQWSTHIPNLWLLPTGPIAAHSGTVLRLPELQALTQWLLGHNRDTRGSAIEDVVDYIIFDTPTLKEGADAVLVASVADCTVLVVGAGKEQSETLNKAGAIFQQLCSPVLGVVLNRQTAKHRPYFYIEDYRQNPMSAGSASLKNPPESVSMTLQALLPDTPTSTLLAIGNHQDGLAALEDTEKNSVAQSSIPSSPLPGQSGTRQFVDLGHSAIEP